MLHEPSLPLPERVSRDFLLHHRLCPAGLLADGTLAVAVTDASLLGGLDDLSLAYERPVVPQPLPEQDLQVMIARLSADADQGVELASGEPEVEGFHLRRPRPRQPAARGAAGPGGTESSLGLLEAV